MQRAACLLLAGGAAADHLHKYKEHEHLMTERAKQPFHFKHKNTVEVPHEYYGAVQKSTFRSPAINLSPGEAWFTLPNVNTMPFPTPGVPYVIVRMDPDVLTEDGRRPPVSELYPHHWLIYDKLVGGSGDNLGCGGSDSGGGIGAGTFVSNIFGAGAEMRGVHYVYPNGYGYFSTEGGGHFSANIHMIRTVDLSTEHFQDQPNPAGAALKSCIECTYSKGNTGVACLPGMVGNFACCFDGGRCHTNDKSNKTKVTYHLQYDVYWTTDLQAAKPLQYGVLDTWTCGSYGNIKPNMHKGGHNCDDELCTSEVERKFDKDGTIIWAYMHQHVGAINSSMYLNGEYMCSSVPRYGTDPNNAVGNEKDYTVGFDLCIHGDGAGGAKSKKTWPIKKGDKLKVQSLYSVKIHDKARGTDTIPGGEHGGVMGLNYFYLAPTGGYTCSNKQCKVTAKEGVDLATCQLQCKIKPPPPAPPALYSCQGAQCVAAAAGVDIDTCNAACG